MKPLQGLTASVVLFDVEGTLVDSVPLTLRCWQETLRAAGHAVSLAALQHHSGEDPGEMLRALLPAADAAQLDAIKKAQGARFRARCLPEVRPFPNVRPLIEAIRASGRRVGLATTSAPDELAHYLGLLRIADLLDGVATGEDVTHEKPHPDLLEVALERCGGISLGGAVMVGDTPYDAMAARGAGLDALGVLTGGFSKGELTAAGCSAVYGDPADMLGRQVFMQPLASRS